MSGLKYVLRRLGLSPAFSSLFVLTVAMAVGINLGVSAFTQAILFHSLGVPHANRIVYYTLGNGLNKSPFSGPAYEALRTNPSTANSLAWKSTSFRLQTQDRVIRLSGALVSGNTFAVLDLKPVLGRFFGEAEDTPGGGQSGWSAVLGYSYWKSHYGANPDVIGQNIVVAGATVHIVGVLPPEFTGVFPVASVQILLPRRFLTINSPNEDEFKKNGLMVWYVFGRLAPNMSIRTAQADLSAFEPAFRQLADPDGKVFSSEIFGSAQTGSLLKVQDGQSGASMTQFYGPALLAMELLAVSILVFCGCNTLLLLLGRAQREAHATAIRVALGGSIGNSARLAMLEAALLCIVGSLFALPLAGATSRILSRIVQSIHGFEGFPTISPTPSLLLSASTMILVVASLTGFCASTWQARKHPATLLRGGSALSSARSLGSWIIAFEIFASTLLMTVSVLNGIGFRRMVDQQSGFGDGSAVTVALDLPQASSLGRDEIISNKQSKERLIIDRIEASPGVEGVAMMNMPPLDGGSAMMMVTTKSDNGASHPTRVWPAEVSDRYFTLVGTSIVKGRGFAAGDLAGDPVCVLSRPAAAALFHGQSAVGEYVYRANSDAASGSLPSAPYCRVIGIAEDAHIETMSGQADAAVYLLSKQEMPILIVKAATSALAEQAVHGALKAVDPAALDSGTETIETRVEDDLRVWKAITLAGQFSACVAAVILGIGLFGILSLQVGERRRIIGIQMALGASRPAVCMSAIHALKLPVCIGFSLGAGSAILAAQGLADVYGLSSLSTIGAYAFSLMLLGTLLVAAAWWPLRRALRVSPAECLSSQ